MNITQVFILTLSNFCLKTNVFYNSFCIFLNSSIYNKFFLNTKSILFINFVVKRNEKFPFKAIFVFT